MPEDKFCPFCHMFSTEKHPHCKKSECELWSTEMAMCSITVGMLAILNAADVLRGISEQIKNHYPD